MNINKMKKDSLLTQKQMNQLMYKTYSNLTNNSSTFTGTSTGNTQPKYDREYEVIRIVRPHSKGYYYVISVDNTDGVSFQVLYGGKFSYWWYKLTGKGRPVAGILAFQAVHKRTHLPATLGAAHKAIDEAVASHKETGEHDKYITEMLKTEPENLKMIEGLERLQEGDSDDNVPSIQIPLSTAHQISSAGLIGPGSGTFSSTSVLSRMAEALRDKTDEEMMGFKASTEAAGQTTE